MSQEQEVSAFFWFAHDYIKRIAASDDLAFNDKERQDLERIIRALTHLHFWNASDGDEAPF